MNKALKRVLLASTCTTAFVCGSLALAQVSEPDDVEQIEEQPVFDDRDDQDEVVVTGSRIRRDAFSSISPLQIVTGQSAREVGLVDASAIVQSTVAATGVQIDSTFNGFVLDNGPLAETIGLRGLGADRTLVLLNSKRLGPAGVGGAPTAADLSLLPSIMIDQVEQLLDGASSVYGSDAVAGVTNIILRDDLDGFEARASYDVPVAGGGEELILTAAWGKSFDRGSIGIAVEYGNDQEALFRDRDFVGQCDRFLQVRDDGQIFSDDISLVPGTTINPCKLTTINRVFIDDGNPFGNVWYTPGTSNIGIPNFSETTVSPGLAGFNSTINPVDVDGDGVADFGIVDPDGNGLTEVDLKNDLYNFNGSPRSLDTQFSTPQERLSLYSYGNYNLGDAANTELYFEGLYTRREGELFRPGASIFPEVPGTNPFNPCNQNAPGGVNCVGFFGPFNFGNPSTTPIVVVRDDRDFTEVETDFARMVFGARGDLPFIDNADIFGFSGWSYDAFVSYNWANGQTSRRGILEPNLEFSINNTVLDPNSGEPVCQIPDGETGEFYGTGPCVPVNMFADSLYQPGGGTFATEAETNYLFGERSFDTTTHQVVASGIVQGDTFEIWNGTKIPLVLGFEYRYDEVDSIPNDIAADGALFAFFSDLGAQGDRSLTEFFGETAITPLTGEFLAEDLTFEAAFRWTEESNFGAQWTYSLRANYAPTDYLKFRGTYGTSFRAPNAAEQFLLGTSGFQTITDPCFVPTDARIPALDPSQPDGYDPSLDTRAPAVLANCQAQGVDPTILGLDGGGDGRYSVEVFDRGGAIAGSGLDPETSTSFTYGVVFEQPFTEAFDLRLAATYYSIEIDGSIGQLSTQSIINECYGADAIQQGFFCGFIDRDEDNILDQAELSFFNVSEENSKGWDFNLFFEDDYVVFDKILNFEIDMLVNNTVDREFQFDEDSIVQENAGRPAFPEWSGRAFVNLDYGNWGLNWLVRFIGESAEFEPAIDPNAEACENLGFSCQPKFRTESYYVHNLSLNWEPREDLNFILGVGNVFDVEPELLDGDATGTQINNVPIGSGYDFDGRRIFFQAGVRF